MRRFTLSLALGLSLAGCAHAPDVEVRNPLVAGAVEDNKIVKPHDYVENNRGLPRGSVADEAALLSLDAQQICFGLTMHELDPIDFREMDVELSTPKGPTIEQARVEPTPVTFQSYDGLVPETRVTGEQTVCSHRNGDGICTAWDTRPIKSTTMVPGQVKVYEAKGRLCFANPNAVTAATNEMALIVKLRRRLSSAEPVVAGGFGMWGMAGGGQKKIAFRWGLGGGSKNK
jgi:hypothetical protein